MIEQSKTGALAAGFEETPRATIAAGYALKVDRDLVNAYLAKNDQYALHILYARHFDFLFSFSRKKTGNDRLAEEVCNDSFRRALLALQKGGGFPGERDSLRPYLVTTARHLIIDYARERTRRDRHCRNETDEVAISPRNEEKLLEARAIVDSLRLTKEELFAHRQKLNLRIAIRRVCLDCRSKQPVLSKDGVIFFEALRGRSPKKIASAMKLSRRAVEESLSRTRNGLRREFLLLEANSGDSE